MKLINLWDLQSEGPVGEPLPSCRARFAWALARRFDSKNPAEAVIAGENNLFQTDGGVNLCVRRVDAGAPYDLLHVIGWLSGAQLARVDLVADLPTRAALTGRFVHGAFSLVSGFAGEQPKLQLLVFPAGVRVDYLIELPLFLVNLGEPLEPK